jgi:hypothetical protein
VIRAHFPSVFGIIESPARKGFQIDSVEESEQCVHGRRKENLRDSWWILTLRTFIIGNELRGTWQFEIKSVHGRGFV